MTSPEGNKSSDQPDLGKAAKDFWAAAKAKAKEVGGKAAEKARDVGAKAIEEAKHVQDTGQPGKAPTDPASNLKGKALDVWRRAPTLVVVSGLGLLLLCSSCCICTGMFSMLSGSRGFPVAGNQKTLSESRGSALQPSFQKGGSGSDSTTDPIIAGWTRKACTVYELKEWQNHHPALEEGESQLLRVVINTKNELAAVYENRHPSHPDGTTEGGWEARRLNHYVGDSTGNVSDEWSYNHEKKSIEWKHIVYGNGCEFKTFYRIVLHLDDKLDEGYWGGTYIRDADYGPSLRPKHEEKRMGNSEGKAGDVVIHRP